MAASTGMDKFRTSFGSDQIVRRECEATTEETENLQHPYQRLALPCYCSLGSRR